MKLTRDFFIPTKYTAKVNPKGIQAEIYLINERGTFQAIGFGGRRARPDFNYLFRTNEQRQNYVEKYIKNAQKAHDEKLERLGRKKNFKHTLEVGSILYSSWGYDQTNIDFYQVVEVVGNKSVKLRKICKSVDHSETGSDYVIASKDDFVKDSKPMLKTVREGNTITLNSYSSAYPWDGKPKYETAFGWGH